MRVEELFYELVLVAFTPLGMPRGINAVLRCACSGGVSLLVSHGVWAAEMLDTAWTEERRTIAETWRVVDGLYLDRTFNGKDWFKVRQSGLYENSGEPVAARVRHMLTQLGDKYTRYLTSSEYEAMMLNTVGHLVGIGVELEKADQGDSSPVVVRVDDGSPAELAGLRAGDVVVNVDGAHTSKLSAAEVSSLMR
jgi:carboxyl-terminal processing protease